MNDSKDKEKNGNNDNDDEESVVENIDQRIEDQSLSGEKKTKACQETLTGNLGWAGICPVRFVSGCSSINPKTLEITGLPNRGFSSVGTKGILLT